MKKIYLTLPILLCCFTVFAQLPNNLEIPDKERQLSEKDKIDYSAKRQGEDISQWMNYGRFMRNTVGASGSYYRNFLYPDSSVVANFNTGLGNVWKHSMGQLIDPYTDVMKDYDYVKIGDWTPYSIDSIGIIYRYNRFNDVGDYLIVQIYETSSLTLIEKSSWQSGASYGYAPYDYTQRKGANGSYKEIRYDLTQADTAIYSQGVIGIEVNSKDFTGPVAVVLTYFPGKEAALGDTIDYITHPDAKNKVNAFLAYDFTDELPYIEVGNFNMAQSIITSVRYNTNDNGWNGKFIPGTSYASSGRIYHYDMAVKITYNSDGIGMNEINNGIGIYPNPARDILKVEANDFDYDITDMSGKSIIKGHSNNGHINISNIEKGTYILNLNKENNISTVRFSKS